MEHLVPDSNGTLACDDRLIRGVKRCLHALTDRLRLHVLTAGTVCGAVSKLENVPCRVRVLGDEGQGKGKPAHGKKLGLEKTVSVGNGCNDRLMLKGSAPGIAVFQAEGAAAETLLAAAIVCAGIESAFDLPTEPKRRIATLRC